MELTTKFMLIEIFCGCSSMDLNNFVLTLQMRNFNNFSTITCLSWNKKNTSVKVLTGSLKVKAEEYHLFYYDLWMQMSCSNFVSDDDFRFWYGFASLYRHDGKGKECVFILLSFYYISSNLSLLSLKSSCSIFSLWVCLPS